MPVIVSTVSLTEPKTRHVLFNDNVGAKVPVGPSTPSKPRKLDALLSSELTDLDESDTDTPSPAAPTKKRGRGTDTRPAQSNNRSITVLSGSPASDNESPPKRSKRSRTSASSIEVSEIVQAPKQRTRAALSKQRANASGKQKVTSKALIDSDGEEIGEAPEVVEGAKRSAKASGKLKPEVVESTKQKTKASVKRKAKPKARVIESDDEEMEEAAQVLDAKGGLPAIYLVFIALTSSS